MVGLRLGDRISNLHSIKIPSQWKVPVKTRKLNVFCVCTHRSVVVPVKKPPPGSLAVNTVGTPTTSGVPSSGSTPNIFAAATATPKSMINTTGKSS